MKHINIFFINAIIHYFDWVTACVKTYKQILIPIGL